LDKDTDYAKRVAVKNIEKLIRRYPEGFGIDRSMNRNE
jgi:hypothetical protein